jgi:N-acetylglutamate synthase-like GNAT family acetyltransferase
VSVPDQTHDHDGVVGHGETGGEAIVDEAGGEVVVGPLDDLDAMRRLGVACGLEDTGRQDEGILAAWGAFVDGRLVGAICLERQGRLDTVNWMAVDERYRRRGVATALFAALELEAKERGMPRLWVTARAPGFFIAQGFDLIASGPERDALLGGCLSCGQFGGVCDPRALTKRLEETDRRDP